MSIERKCANIQCENPVPVEQALYCSDKCRMKAYRARKSKRARPLDEQQPTVTAPVVTSGKLINANDLMNVVDVAKAKAWDESLKKTLKPR